MKSDRSMGEPACFSNEHAHPSDTNFRSQRADSVLSRDQSTTCDNCSNFSPGFSTELPSSAKERKGYKGGAEEELQSCCRSSVSPQTPGQTNTVEPVCGLQEVLHEHKMTLKRRCERVTEGTDEVENRTLLNRIYTELYITEGQPEEVNTQHEIRQLEAASKMKILHDTPIKCHKIFKVLPDQDKHIRVVQTNGIAGIGKTFLVQKFTLDWAEGFENQDVSVVILLSFRELNLVRYEQHSLLTLLHVFHPSLQKVTAEMLGVCKPLFIFDGLDESRLLLDFNNSKVVSDVTQMSSVNVLLTNLIKGNLLPSALVWVTSRPAAANHIPPTCIDRVTEVRGFTEAQKEEYFRKRFSDEELSNRIISHIKTLRSLHIMCYIPIFCWITATVLYHMLTTNVTEGVPKTLTNIYSHFLMVQTKRKKHKYDEGHTRSTWALTEVDKESLLKLGRLAFEHLQRGNMFYREDLEQCGVDVTEASVYSGISTEIFKREFVIFQKKMYCFVHLSIQEFLAAVYIFHCYTKKDNETLETFLGNPWGRYPLESRKSVNGHLNLFVCFLHGLSMESNQRLLGDLLGQMGDNPASIQKAIHNLKFKNRSETKLSEIHCSGLAFMPQISEEILDIMDIQADRTSREGRFKPMPTVRVSNPSHLNKPYLSNNDLRDTGMQMLSAGLESLYCWLETVRMSFCSLTDTSCNFLTSALKSNPSYLRELDLQPTICWSQQ